MDINTILHQFHLETAKRMEKETLCIIKESAYRERILYLLWDKYDFSRVHEVRHWETCGKIATGIGLNPVTAKDSRMIGSIIRHIYQGNDKMFRQAGNQKLVRIPPLRAD